MNRLRRTLMASTWFALIALANPVAADPPKDEQLVDRLEKRVAALEKKLAEFEAQGKSPLKPVLEQKLLGSWEADDPKGKGLVAVRLEPNGKCRVLLFDAQGKRQLWSGNYETTGKHIRFTLEIAKNASVIFNVDVVKATDNTLVLKGQEGEGWVGEWEFSKQ